MGTVTNDVLSVEAQQTAGQGKQFTPDRIAALLDGWRPHVLREMGRRRLWRGEARRLAWRPSYSLVVQAREGLKPTAARWSRPAARQRLPAIRGILTAKGLSS